MSATIIIHVDDEAQAAALFRNGAAVLATDDLPLAGIRPSRVSMHFKPPGFNGDTSEVLSRQWDAANPNAPETSND